MAFFRSSLQVAPKRVCGKRLAFEWLEPRQMLAVTALSPDADTYTRSGGNAGTAQVLDTLDNGGGDFMAYVRFDLSGVDLDGIESATLTLHKLPGSRNDVIIPERFDVYGLANEAGNTPQDWDEATLANGNLGAEYTNTGGNQLDFSRVVNLDEESGADVVESVINNDGAPQSLSGPDLLEFLQDRVDDNGLATFIVLVDAGQARGWGYGAREHANPDVRPRLELDDGEPIPDPYPENPVILPRQMEQLDRGLIAVRSGANEVYVGWRLLGNDPAGAEFNLYRSADGAAPVKLNDQPLQQTTDFVDTTVDPGAVNEYFVRPVVGGVEQEASSSFSLAANSTVQQFLDVPLQVPAGGQTPTGENYSYSANDTSVGDLDGDGQYELIVKWDPSNAKDNSQGGYTGNVYVDAYALDGELLWRIDLGRNIRAGAHYTQFMVYDLDDDGRAEVAMKTAPGTVDGQGQDVILPGDNPAADYRNSSGYVLAGPEYLTVFDGLTGAELMTVDYVVPRHPTTENPSGSQLDAIWGDNYGNRVDRFLAGIAYLDGQRPSLVMARGYYTRTVLAAWDFRDGELEQRWVFDTHNDPSLAAYAGQGDHSLSVADVDGDGKDEIVYGAMVVDEDGSGLYSTGLGHGDALHVSDMDPTNPGLEVFTVHEDPGSYQGAGGEFRDAMTGELLFPIASTNDVGRGVAFDVDPDHLGYEMWATTNAGPRMVYNSQGEPLYSTSNLSYNFGVWWDADPLRELLDGTTISKWRYDAGNPFAQNILSPGGVSSNNGTKANPALSADLLGDWREEVVWRSNDSSSLRIYTTTIAADMRLPTLMHDSQYRTAIAWQNAGYNQPPHPSFYLGDGMETPPQPSIYFAGDLPGDYNADGTVNAADYTVWRDAVGSDTILPNDTTPGTVSQADYAVWKGNFGAVAPAGGSAAAAVPSALGGETASAIAPSDSAAFESHDAEAPPWGTLEIAAAVSPSAEFSARIATGILHAAPEPTLLLSLLGNDEPVGNDRFDTATSSPDEPVRTDPPDENELLEAVDLAFEGFRRTWL